MNQRKLHRRYGKHATPVVTTEEKEERIGGKAKERGYPEAVTKPDWVTMASGPASIRIKNAELSHVSLFSKTWRQDALLPF